MRSTHPPEQDFCGFWKNLALDIVFNELHMDYRPQYISRDDTREKKDRYELISDPPYGKLENGR